MAYSRGRCLLDYWLKKRSISREDFARKMGWSLRMVHHWCNDTRLMSVDAMYTAAQILGIRMEDLYQWSLTVKE